MNFFFKRKKAVEIDDVDEKKEDTCHAIHFIGEILDFLVEFAKIRGATCELSKPDDLIKKQVAIGDMVVIFLDVLNELEDKRIEIVLRLIRELRKRCGAGIFITVWTKHANANPFIRQELMEFDKENDWER